MSIMEKAQLFNNQKIKQIIIGKNKIEEMVEFIGFCKYDKSYENKVKMANSVFNLGLITEIIPIKNKNKIISQKLFLNNKSTPQDWIPAWHATKIENLESIIKYCLKKQRNKITKWKKLSKNKIP